MNRSEALQVYPNLHGADLHGADLHGADLRGAYLRCADLRGAYLDGADLRGAYLCCAKGILRLPVGDPRGYDCVAVRHKEKWMIAAGCRWFTVQEASAHWSSIEYPDHSIGDRYLSGLRWLSEQETPTDGL